MMHKIYKIRLQIEAATPLRVGSGKAGLLVDSLVAKDAQGLPYIPGTSLAGVLRHSFEAIQTEKHTKDVFGFQEKEVEKGESYPKGQGSRLVFTDAHLLGLNNVVHESPQFPVSEEDQNHAYYQAITRLPERDHVRINHRGTAVDGAKYEEELVCKGVRFVFDLELHSEGDEADQSYWNQLLDLLKSETFRIGAGTRKGYGKLSIVQYEERVFDLKEEKDLNDYLNYPNSLNSSFQGEIVNHPSTTALDSERYTTYNLHLTPKDFFLFSDGLGDGEINALPKTETVIKWENGEPTEKKDHLLIPATSIKGALSHRMAYHYNLLNGVCIEEQNGLATDAMPPFDVEDVINQQAEQFSFLNIEQAPDSELQWRDWEKEIEELTINDLDEWKNFQQQIKELSKNTTQVLPAVGEQNEAVKALFGFARDEDTGQRGRVIFSDKHIPKEDVQKKVFNHVSIDRFTGGVKNGALFQEKAATTGNFTFQLYVENEAFEGENGEIIRQALMDALKDLMKGRLALGGQVAKGHGIFSGQLIPQEA